MNLDPIIKVDKLDYSYPGGTSALEGISFCVEADEHVGIVGPNGAGKTTLFLSLMGILPGKPGSVQIAGLDPAVGGQRRQLPRKVGLVLQNSDDQIFNATIADDIAFGPLNLALPPDEIRSRVAEAIARVGLQGLEDRPPTQLSGGEKRRTAIAGILAMRPEILLLDEPSMYLDPRGRRELIRLLQTLPGTKLVASHDLEMILQICSRVLLLDNGRLIAQGDVREILSDSCMMEKHGLEVPYSLRRG